MNNKKVALFPFAAHVRAAAASCPAGPPSQQTFPHVLDQRRLLLRPRLSSPPTWLTMPSSPAVCWTAPKINVLHNRGVGGGDVLLCSSSHTVRGPAEALALNLFGTSCSVDWLRDGNQPCSHSSLHFFFRLKFTDSWLQFVWRNSHCQVSFSSGGTVFSAVADLARYLKNLRTELCGWAKEQVICFLVWIQVF